MQKNPSIISVIITTILLLLFGAGSLFMTIIALNGFSDSSGRPALATTLVCNGVGILLAGVAAWFLPRLFVGKFNWNSTVAVIVSVLVGLFFGGGVSFLSILVGVAVADSLWRAR